MVAWQKCRRTGKETRGQMTLSSRATDSHFLIAGGIGFLIGISIHIGVSILGSDLQSPRFSYPVALVWTWYVNRTMAFR